MNSDTLQHMDPDYAQKFKDAGLVPEGSSGMALDPAADRGKVRTWMAGSTEPTDMTPEEAVELYADNFSDIVIPEGLTIWDDLDAATVTLKYANGMTYPLAMNVVDGNTPASRLLNHSNYLVIPADESLNPVLTGRTMPNLFHVRIQLLELEKQVKDQQLEIGRLVWQFSEILKEYQSADWKDPVGVFRDGLDTSPHGL